MSAPHQLLLNLKLEWVPTLDNYVAGGNQELLSRLNGMAGPRCTDAVYLWGADGGGKSHLLSAVAGLATQRPVRALSGATAPDDIQVMPGTLLLVDDVHELSAAAQIALFRIFNSSRLLGLSMLLSGPCRPLALALREDLRTRIGQCMIYEIQNLSDEEKQAALRRHALLRGMRLDDSVLHYLLRHGRRDLPSLMAMLDNLDRASLEQKRQATVPLLRELMQSSQESDTQ